VRILVVDDEAFLREFLAEELARLGHEMVAASTAPEALAELEHLPPDLILLDLRMPGMDGVDALRKLRDRKARAPIIVLTARRNPETIAHAKSLGACEVLFKPVDLSQLFEIVKRKLGG